MSSYADRPPPEPERFLHALAEWRAGEATAGTTTQTLKRGGFDELLAANADEVPEAAAAWNRWERGEVPPRATLEALAEHGIDALLERIRDAQREAFGAP